MSKILAVTKKQEMTILEELTLIADSNNGFIDPVKVVEYARSPDTALHSKFEWDDTEAAEKYRIWQARMIIRAEVEVITEANDTPSRRFVSLLDDRKADTDRGYRAMVSVLSDEALRMKLLDEAKRDMLLFRRKYSMLKELAEVFAAMDKF